MSDAAELAAIHAEFAEPVIYTGAGLTDSPITAIPSDFEDDGMTRTVRRRTYEIQFAELPGEPGKADHIVHDGETWSVIDKERHRDVQAWVLSVEKVA